MADRARGIDISVHQANTPALAGLDFVICRASYGDYPDTRYAEHAANVRARGLMLGAYLFLRNQPPADQVATFLRVSRDADFWAVDYEKDKGHPHVTPEQTREVIRRIQSTGRKVGLYATQYTMFRAGQDWDWVADWQQDEPPGDWMIWQYRGSPLDLNVFRGDADDMRRWLGMARLPVTNPDPHRIRIQANSPVYSPDGAKIDTQSAVVERVGLARVHLGNGGATYWAIINPMGGGRELSFVKVSDTSDLGELQIGGPTPADVAKAKADGFADAKTKAVNAVKGI